MGDAFPENRQFGSPQASEAAIAYHMEREQHHPDVKQSNKEQLCRRKENVGMVAGQHGESLGCFPVQGNLPTSTVSRLPVLVSTLVDVAQELGLESGETYTFMEAAQQVAGSDKACLQSAASIVRETLHLIQSIRWRQGSVSAKDTDGIRNAAELARGQSNSCRPNGLGHFLSLLAEVWGSLYGASDVYRHQVVHSLQHGFATTAINAVEHLVHLAVLAWERARVSGAGGETTSSEGRSSERSECRPWVPILQLMAWGVVPAVTAENVVLSCLEVFETSKLREGATRNGQDRSNEPSRDALIAVASAVAKGYHSLGAEEDLSTVVLTDLLDVAARSIKPRRVGTKISGWYHSMNLCRLVARLEVL